MVKIAKINSVLGNIDLPFPSVFIIAPKLLTNFILNFLSLRKIHFYTFSENVTLYTQ